MNNDQFAAPTKEMPRGLPRISVKWSIVVTLGVLAATVIGAVLVYMAGGTQFPLSHIMYVPILVAAFAFPRIGGVLAGIAAGLALGPLMPFGVDAGEAQTSIGWLTRTGLFAVVGGVSGMTLHRLRGHLEDYRWLAYHAATSHLPNQRSLLEILSGLIASRRDSETVAIFHVNIENGTEIAEAFGFESIERLMETVAGRIEKMVPDSAIPACQLLSFALGTAQAAGRLEAESLATQLVQCVSQPIEVEGVSIFVDTVVGVAIAPDHGTNPVALLQIARIAARQAAERGRRVWVHQTGETTKKDALALLARVPQAIAENEFVLHYQPIVRLQDGRLVGAEALLRWQHPERGLLAPMSFIFELERTILIHPLHQWALSTVLRCLQSAGFGDTGYVSINLSTRLLYDEQWIEEFAALMRSSRVTSSRVIFEVTETVLMTDPEGAADSLSKLRQLGCRTAIDDFGTGFSSLAYLKLLPIDYIKIDREFITGVDSSTSDQAIVRSAISMAHELDIQVIAEGVETRAVESWLREHQVDFAQGFYYSRPLTPEAFSEWKQNRVL
ncbi:MAG: bifunctional diguanylate cyclase/phosphodiesterase [Thermoanaerobaculia bacterium]|nr:bifunctional diguanylate cyclase/phosphodiesterase [Thermoanaerobaculia bacterium]